MLLIEDKPFYRRRVERLAQKINLEILGTATTFAEAMALAKTPPEGAKVVVIDGCLDTLGDGEIIAHTFSETAPQITRIGWSDSADGVGNVDVNVRKSEFLATLREEIITAAK